MIIQTGAKLFRFRGLNNYATFVVDHESPEKFYYCEFFIEEEKFKEIEFKEGELYLLTIAVSKAMRKKPTKIKNKFAYEDLTRNALFLRDAKLISHDSLKDKGTGNFIMDLVIADKVFMPIEVSNNKQWGVGRMEVNGVKDYEMEYPFYIWDFAAEDAYETLKITNEKSEDIFKYTFNCYLFNKTHYDEEGRPSKEKEELLKNGKNKGYTDIKVDYFREYEEPRRLNYKRKYKGA